MKKLMFAAIAVLGFSAASIAQTTAPKTGSSKMQPVKPTATIARADTKTMAIAQPGKKANTAPVATTPKTTATALKKDGTPDKSYAANTHKKHRKHAKKKTDKPAPTN